MINRKHFLKNIAGSAASLVVAPWLKLNSTKTSRVLRALGDFKDSPENIAQNEDYWMHVQQAFTVDRSLIYLNSAGVNTAPAKVQNAVKQYLDYSYKAPSHVLWRILNSQRDRIRQKLAGVFGTDAEEVAIVRNSSEGLQTCQFGFDMEPGDEVLTTSQAYHRMVMTFRQRERRDGIKLKQFPIPVPAEDDEEIVRLFEENITPRTKMILITHMTNKNGQILPVKKVVNMARAYGVPVIVDGAQTFAHLDFKQKDLDCDYFATSLHKWLSAPLGTGMLYVEKDKIKDLWPLMSAPESQERDIRKFEQIGTHPIGNYLAIGEALTFYEGIGAKRKEMRLKYLNDYWIDQIIDSKRVKLLTSRKDKLSSGIVTIQVDGIDNYKLKPYLWNKFNIIVETEAFSGLKKQYKGIRVSPNVFTTLEELDVFVDAMKKIISNGI